MQAIKEKAANVAASAKSGLEKTKAVVQEKVDIMKAKDPAEKERAAERKEERINQAEIQKQGARDQNAAAAGDASYSYSTTGEPGRPTRTNQMSALPGHGTGQPAGHVTEGVVESRPVGTATGTERASAAHNTRVGAATNKGHGTGDAYT